MQDLSGIQDPVLEELERETHLRTSYPNMLSGPLLGGFLEMISTMIRPDRILEVGTFTGYSAICLARGLAPDGRLYSIETDDERLELARTFFLKAGLSDKIHLVAGNALKEIPQLEGPFDLSFIDGEKEEYPAYFELVMEKCRSGSIILADNVLWGGKVVDALVQDRSTKGIRVFNELVKDDPRVENMILPIRDGINLIRVR